MTFSKTIGSTTPLEIRIKLTCLEQCKLYVTFDLSKPMQLFSLTGRYNPESALALQYQPQWQLIRLQTLL